MLTGLPPFYSKDREQLFHDIKNSTLQYPEHISDACRDFLEKLFIKDPDSRLGGGPRGAEDVMEHPWFERVEWKAIYDKKVRPPFKPKLNNDADTKYIDPEFTTA